MRYLFFFLTLTIISFSCKKDSVQDKQGGAVELYLLESYQLIINRCEIDPSASALKSSPLIKNDDIIEYAQSSYQFKLTEAAIQKIKTLQDSAPFAVTVGKQVIYYGFFKPGYSASSCGNSITMDLDWAAKDKISLNLGYPGQLQNSAIDDQRNNPVLLAALEAQEKLK